jgi:hypothetical protein
MHLVRRGMMMTMRRMCGEEQEEEEEQEEYVAQPRLAVWQFTACPFYFGLSVANAFIVHT